MRAGAIVAAVVLTACGGGVAADTVGASQIAARADAGWELVALGDDAVIEPAGDHSYTNPGAVVNHDGRLVGFRNSFSSWPGATTTDVVTSEDGTVWEPGSDGAVWTNEDVPYGDDSTSAFLFSAYVAADGTWVGYFYTYRGVLATGVIGRATAPGPDGPWTADDQPVLEPGPDGAWDARRVGEPSVQVHDGEIRLYYTGYDDDRTGRIGLATSTDGVEFTKWDDPATTEPPFDDSDPVLVGTQEWDGGTISDPQVLAVEDGFVMTYRSVVRSSYVEGLAVSPDGTTWEPAATNPLVTTETSGGRPIFQSELVALDGQPLLLLEIGGGATAVHAFRLTAGTVDQDG